MTENPFQSPTLDESLVLASSDRLFEIDRNLLVIRSGLVLPARCVYTNQPLAESELRTKTMYYCRPWVFILLLLGGVLPFLLAYWILRKKCVIGYGVCRPERARRFSRGVGVMFGFFMVVILFGLAAFFELSSLAAISIVALFALLSYVVATHRALRVVRHRDGRFWIGGISPAFLVSLDVGKPGLSPERPGS